MTDIFDGVRPEPKRNKWGQYLIVPDGGGKPVGMPRASTVAKAIEARHGLEAWFKRQVAVGMARRPDLVAQAVTARPDDKQTLDAVAKEAMAAAASDAAANIGTALHRITEAHDLGRIDFEVPEQFEADLDAYRRTLELHGVEVLAEYVEQVIVHPAGIAGTFDRVVRIGDELFIFDLKTGTSIEYGAQSHAIQLGIYATASSWYDVTTDKHFAPLDVSKTKAVIAHLPAGTGKCTLYWLDIAAGVEALERALWVRNWQRRNDLLEPITTGVTDADELVAIATGAAAAATDRDATDAPTPAEEAKKARASGRLPKPRPTPKKRPLVVEDGSLADACPRSKLLKVDVGPRGLEPPNGDALARLQHWLHGAYEAGWMWATVEHAQPPILDAIAVLAQWSDDLDVARTIVCHCLDTPAEGPADAQLFALLGNADADELDDIKRLAIEADIGFDADGTMHVAGTRPGPDSYRQHLLDHLRQLLADDKQAVVDAWPAETPGPKRADEWTFSQMSAIEKKFQFPFWDADHAVSP